jgi:hypothetical protein
VGRPAGLNRINPTTVTRYPPRRASCLGGMASAVLGLKLPSWSAADWGQVLSALFTAIAAFAAWVTVFRFERDRRRSSWPDLHVEYIVDIPGEQVRLTVINYGGPAREVRVFGLVADFGFLGYLEPSTYWQPGERRTFRVHMPPSRTEKAEVMVEGRDMKKRYVFVATWGGATYRWRQRPWRKLSAQIIWQRLFPDSPIPLDAKHTPMRVELLEREIAGRISTRV